MEMMEFDGSRYLNDENDCRLYLAEAMKNGDPVEIQSAIADIGKAPCMKNRVAGMSGNSRAALAAISNAGIRDFATVMNVIKSLGFALTVAEKKTGS